MRYSILTICFLLMLLSCKKDEELPEPNQPTEHLNVLLSSPKRLKADKVFASSDGKYIVSLEVLGTGANGYSRLYVSKNSGQNWEIQNVNIYAKNQVYVTKNGLVYFSRDNQRKLYDLNTAQEVDINYAGTITQWDDFKLGNDDFIYIDKHLSSDKSFKQVNASVWTNFTLPGIYCGQDIATGGAAFFDEALNQLHIHNPTNNTITTHEIEINLSQVSQGQSSYPPSFRYSGSDYFAVAHTKGVAVQNLSTQNVQYTNWGGDYQGHYLNPESMSLDDNGVVFATLTYYDQKEAFKIKDGVIEKMNLHVGCHPSSHGIYTYYSGPLRLIRQSQNNITEFETSYQNLENPEWAEIVSARKIGDSYFALLSVLDLSGASVNLLHSFNNATGKFEQVPQAEGSYNYIYADNANVFLFGEKQIAHSSDRGKTWHIAQNTLTGVVKSISYVTRSDNVYYGLATQNYSYDNLSTGQKEDRHKLSTYSSSDGINWIEITSTGEKSGKAPQAVTSDGRMMYESSGALDFSEYTKDYGVSWQLNQDLVPFFTAQLGDKIYSIIGNGNSINQVVYDLQFNKLSEKNISNNTALEVIYSIENVHFDEQTNKVCFVTWRSFLEID